MAKRKTYQPGEPRPKGKQLDGRYRGKVKLGVDMDGKPLYRYVSASSRPELEKKKAELVQRYKEGAAEDNTDILFGAVAQMWYEKKKAGKAGAATLTNHRTILNKHILPAFAIYQMRAITYKQVQDWLDGYAGASQSQINKLYTLIRALFKFAVVHGMVSRDITLAITKPEPKAQVPRRALTGEETEAALRTIDEHPEGLFLAVLYYFGVRRGEALGLWGTDFDWDEGLMHVQRDIVYVSGKITVESLKTDAADRWVPIPEEMYRFEAVIRKAENTWLFPARKGGPLSESAYRRRWLRLMLHAGLAEAKPQPEDGKKRNDLMQKYTAKLTPHYFRHNYITMLYDADVPAAETMRIVGHADYQTTINIYTHIKEERLKKAGANLQKVFPKFKVAEKLPKTKSFIVRIK